MGVEGMKDASHRHKLRRPQAGRCREGWLVIVAGSGGSRHRDSRGSDSVAQRLRWPFQARTSLPPWRRWTAGRNAGLPSGDPHLREEG